MATPMSAHMVVSRLRAAGLKVEQHGDWEHHNRGDRNGGFGPVNGVMIHHTGDYSSQRQIIDLCIRGYSGLPGPLCHGVIDKSGTVHMIGWGRANHAGLGDDDVFRAVVRESTHRPRDNEANTDGNERFYGFECINKGDGRDPWPEVQVRAAAIAAGVLCKHHRWNERSVIGHNEWQPGKPDPRGPNVSMPKVRGLVDDFLAGKLDGPEPPSDKPKPKPKPPTLEERVTRLERRLKAAGIK